MEPTPPVAIWRRGEAQKLSFPDAHQHLIPMPLPCSPLIPSPFCASSCPSGDQASQSSEGPRSATSKESCFPGTGASTGSTTSSSPSR